MGGTGTIILSEISQSVKDKYRMASLTTNIMSKLTRKIEPEKWKHGTD